MKKQMIRKYKNRSLNKKGFNKISRKNRKKINIKNLNKFLSKNRIKIDNLLIHCTQDMSRLIADQQGMQ